MCQILDIHPGYLGNQELINETGFLHRLISESEAANAERKNVNNQGPQTECQDGWDAYRHYLWNLAEMKFRGIRHEYPEIPVLKNEMQDNLPVPLSSPAQQLGYLYNRPDIDNGARIPLPKNSQQLWAQHKYSILARDVNLYRELGPGVAKMKSVTDFSKLAEHLTLSLRIQPNIGGIRNALQHMWGYVSDRDEGNTRISEWSLQKLNHAIQDEVVKHGEKYLMHSTALTDLQTWLPESDLHQEFF